MHKDIKALVAKLQDRELNPGWRVEDRTKHLMAFPADKAHGPITIPLTPSDRRSILNTRAALRRAGAKGI